ncbi:ABC transporter ATP-binding protein [Myxococcus xanthus]|uniref:ABC transporter ATP-binding protein n=1 Tax=Myxococcus xanthus TaxID=34 RepID=A0A7Y4ICU8_MYXXA|nr:ABC transporter ATP-binding protein [Myxococcus xanthus]NOJ76804.1 ABC transporter ATP-binding protein [Myxococcus xanthus]NOJ84263.1 ABC transporter ATP-binding protein [Myxococcus xanthus]
MARLFVEDLYVRLGTNDILKGITADFRDGEVVALLGRSGSGKSTLLRSVAGLETPVRGRIHIGERTVFDAAAKVNLPPERRDLGLVFQSYALWPHKTVFDNVAYGLRLRKQPREQVERAVREVLQGVGLEGYGDRFPSQLSGGQQQRVALARALVYGPPLVLLDEPLSNLDAKLREEARVWIRALIKRLGLTALFVTHDQVEAMAIADRIMLLDGGRMVQDGTPEQLYTEPRSLFAADFMGVNNTLPGRVVEQRGGEARLQVGSQSLWGLRRGDGSGGDSATGVIRVEELQLASEPGENRLPAALVSSIYVGGRWEHQFHAAGQTLRASTRQSLAPGAYTLAFPRERLWIF